MFFVKQPSQLYTRSKWAKLFRAFYSVLLIATLLSPVLAGPLAAGRACVFVLKFIISTTYYAAI
jgi:hypothetical protein